jgi:4'-phosphopantetheinyl transferase
MPELIRFVNPSFRSLIWHITESVDLLLERIPLSENEYDFFSKLKTEQRKKQWLSYRSALMSLNDDVHIPIGYTEIGKPILSDFSAQISVSHSGSYAQAIISDRIRVGVDIEVVSETAHRVRHKFMSHDEIEYADSVAAKRISLFTWCAKEAMYKAMGMEGVIFAHDMKLFDFNFEEMTAKGIFDFKEIKTPFDFIFFQQDDFISAMCCEK